MGDHRARNPRLREGVKRSWGNSDPNKWCFHLELSIHGESCCGTFGGYSFIINTHHSWAGTVALVDGTAGCARASNGAYPCLYREARGPDRRVGETSRRLATALEARPGSAIHRTVGLARGDSKSSAAGNDSSVGCFAAHARVSGACGPPTIPFI